jgi:hypothetical protein
VLCRQLGPKTDKGVDQGVWMAENGHVVKWDGGWGRPEADPTYPKIQAHRKASRLCSTSAASFRIRGLELVYFDHLPVRHQLHEPAVVGIGVRGRLARSGWLVVGQ